MKIKIINSLICLLAIISIPSCVNPDGSLAGYTNVSLNVLPSGYQTVYVSGSPYYYVRNTWYRRAHNGYVSCPRPHGYRGSLGAGYYGGYGDHSDSDYGLTHLPYGYQTVSYGSQIYYNNGNSWYRRNGGRYHVCSEPSGYYNSYSRRRPSYQNSYHSNHNHHSDNNHYSRSNNYSDDQSNNYSRHTPAPTYTPAQSHTPTYTPSPSAPSTPSSGSEDNSHKSRSHYMNSLNKD
jgi:hypothetical protein